MAKKILKTAIGGLTGFFTGGPIGALGGAAAGLAGSLLHKKKSSSTTTAADGTTPTMPLPDDQAVMQAKKEAILRARARGGRSSTILTGDTSGSTLGGY